MAPLSVSKPISLIVSFLPGGEADVLAGVFAENCPTVSLSRWWKKTGASSSTRNSFVVKAHPDGYTLLFTPDMGTTALLVLEPDIGTMCDSLTDFTTIMSRAHSRGCAEFFENSRFHAGAGPDVCKRHRAQETRSLPKLLGSLLADHKKPEDFIGEKSSHNGRDCSKS